jgi:DNA-binding response OmpR family regulator
MTKILIIEDDKPLGSVITNWLQAQNYSVECVDNGADGKALLEDFQYDLVVLDWTLPDIQGIDILRHFRARGGRTPILMLTGKTEIVDKETGLDFGADDYLTKPFDIKELGARVRALLRRPTSAYIESVIQVGEFRLNPQTRQATRGDEPLKLSVRECLLLEFFLRHPDTVFTGEALIERVWKSDKTASMETLRTSIKRLRVRIDRQSEPSYIENVFGVGYRFNSERTPHSTNEG